MGFAGNLIARLLLDKSNYSSGLKTADKEAQTFKKGGSSAFNALKVAGVAAFAAVTAATIKAIKDAAGYEKTLANISTMVTSNVKPTMDTFNDALLEQSKLLGEDVQTLGKGLYDILSAGITDTSDAMHVLKVSAMAARAGLTDTGVAADALTTIINAYGLEASQASTVSDILFKTVQRGKTTFAELAPSVGRVATIAAQAGVGMEEMGAALAVMTRRGVKTDEAITALRGVITGFLKPTDALTEAFGENALQSRGLAEVLNEMAGMSPDVIAKFFPNVRGMLGAITAAQEMQSETQLFIDTIKDGSPTLDAFDKQTNTFSFTWDQFAKTLQATSIQIGQKVLPAVGDAIKDITQFINDNEEAIISIGDIISDVFTTIVDFGGQVFTLVGELAGEVIGFLKENQELIEGFGKVIQFVLKGIVGALKLIITPVTAVTRHFKEMSILEKEINVVSQEQADQMLELAGRYDDLSKKTNKTSAEKEEFKKVTEELNKILPESANNLLKEARAADIDAQLLLKRKLILEGEENLVELQKKMNVQIKERNKAQKRLNNAQEQFKKNATFSEAELEAFKAMGEIPPEAPANMKQYAEEVERTKEEFEKWDQAVIDTQDSIWFLEKSLDDLLTTDSEVTSEIQTNQKKVTETAKEENEERVNIEEEARANILQGLIAYHQFVRNQDFQTAEQRKKSLDEAVKKNEEAAEMAKNAWKKAYEEIKNTGSTVLSFLGGAVGAYFDMQESLIDANVSDEEEAARQKAKLAIKEFNFNKVRTIIQIGIDTASAVVKSWPNLILSGIIAALGAAQAIFVAAQAPPPMPAFQGGGIVRGNPGIDTTPALLTDGEFIVNKNATARNRGALEAINAGQNIMPEINLVPIPINIRLSDGRLIGKADLQFIQKESKFGGVLIHPRAIKEEV